MLKLPLKGTLTNSNGKASRVPGIGHRSHKDTKARSFTPEYSGVKINFVVLCVFVSWWQRFIFGLLMFSICFTSCKKDKDKLKGEWLIPKSEVLDGGPGKDGIPALTNPAFIAASDATYLQDNDLVVGFISGNDVRAYPHAILDQHEIINDDINGVSLAVTYCPLTGTGIGWNRNVNGTNTTFGVSGLLYNTNLIPYDRATGSNWSQMKLLCVNGSLIRTKVQVIPVVETTWKTWKAMYAQTKVVSKQTGYSRNYDRYPYGDYKTNNDNLLFPLNPKDNRLPSKERVHGVIINDKAKVYQYYHFTDSIQLINDSFQNTDLVIAGSQPDNFIVSFVRRISNDTLLTFTPVQNKLPVIMQDNEGTEWDIFGFGVSGPGAGEKLTPAVSFIGYWLAWGAFYPGAAIY